MSYSLKNSAQSVTYTVADNTENSTSTSLTFIGKNFTGYGLALNENFVYLLENFSNTVGNYPLNPISGQLFWDNTNKYMHVYDGAAWKVIYGALNSLTVNTSISSASLTVTNTATSGYSTKDISILGGSTNNIYLIGNTGQGVYNGLVNAGDMLLGFQAATQGNGNLVIAPWASVSGGSGIKINSVANVATITLQSPTTTISGNVGIGTTTVTANLVVYGSATGISQARVGNSIVQIQDGLGRVVANFLGGVDGSTKPTYATLNLGGAASTPIAFSLATTHGVSIGSNSATISTTGVVAAPTINAGTIGNSGATFTGATATFNGGLSQVAQTLNTNPASQDAGRIFAIYNTNYLPGASYSSSDNRIIDFGVQTGNIAYIRTGGTNGLQLNAGGNGFSFNNAILPSSNASINIGGTGSNYWNNIYAVNFLGTSTTAKYADLAEKYLPDAQYEIGTVMMVGGSAEVTQHSGAKVRAIGVISAYPAYKMNSDLDGGVYVALKGRVPVRVVGPIKKGQALIGTAHGLAVAQTDDSQWMFAIALEDFNTSSVGLVEAVIL